MTADVMPLLTNLDGLEALRFVGGHFYLGDNPPLADASALAGLEFVGDDLEIYRNPLLTSLPFASLVEGGGYLLVQDNESLTSLASLSTLTTQAEAPDINRNPLITDLTGLGQLTSFDGTLAVNKNAALSSLSHDEPECPRQSTVGCGDYMTNSFAVPADLGWMMKCHAATSRPAIAWTATGPDSHQELLLSL